jgi:16S rRNA (adenine1518-N6/adenine1519-N6)-dimethyltransferase
VVSFEVDRGVYRLARKRLQGIEGITLVHGDFLRADSGRYFRGTYLVVANIPYSIAGRILMRLWEESERVAGSYLLVPRELGARLTAPIPGKNAGVLPVLLQTAFRARLVRDVSRTAFFPVPRVDSAYLELLPRKQGLSESERRALRDLLRIGFSQRRKMLLKRLEAAYRNAGGTFRTMGIPENARPEMLSTDQWPELARTLETRRGETGRGDSARRTS